MPHKNHIKTGVAIHWFRQDLRLTDNPGLLAAAEHETVLPIYILDNDNAGENQLGGASKVWLHHSLTALNASLDNQLSVYAGDAKNVLLGLIERFDIQAIYWNRCYEPWRVARDTEIKTLLKEKQITVKSFCASLLWEPWKVTQKNGASFQVFTPFYRKGCLKAPLPREPLAKAIYTDLQADAGNSISITALKLVSGLDWTKSVIADWPTGEAGATQMLEQFLKYGLGSYKQDRNLPAKRFVSRLSPYLHFGEISPHQVWQAARSFANDKHVDHFCSELGWREFSYHLQYHHPDLATKNLQNRFNHFDWLAPKDDREILFTAWTEGNTGVPMVDAGMRELWQTGYMHNRARMIAGSYLVKNLQIHWRYGERWFWDTLFDADLANNSASWQWVAGSGADPVEYFRIFNPMLQGRKFDPNGAYIRRYLPEISALPDEYLFSPWQAPEEVLIEAGIELGNTYPNAIVDFEETRKHAQQLFDALPANTP